MLTSWRKRFILLSSGIKKADHLLFLKNSEWILFVILTAHEILLEQVNRYRDRLDSFIQLVKCIGPHLKQTFNVF